MLNALKSTKKKAWIIIGVSTFLILGSAGVAYMDYSTIGDEEQQIAVLETENTRADTRISKINSIEDRVLRDRLIVKERVKILPDDKDINQFVKKISDFSADSGVEITRLDDSAARNRGRRQSSGAFLDVAYKLELAGTMDQFLEFMHRFETHDRFVKVKSFSISNNETSRDEEIQGLPLHKIELVLETYIYKPAKGSRPPVNILNGDKRTVALLEKEPEADTLELQVYNYHPQSGRRDIFADPRQRAGASQERNRIVAQDAAKQKEVLEELIKEFAVIKTALSDEQKIKRFVEKIAFAEKVSDRIAALARTIEELTANKVFRDPDLLKKFHINVKLPFSVVYDSRQDMDSRGLAHRELKVEYEHMLSAFEAGLFEDVLASSQALGSVKSANVGTEITALFTKIDAISSRASARLEFAQIPINLRGYVFQDDKPEQAVIIINNRAYSRGDVLADGVIVGRIDLSQVVFLYKDEEITKALD